MGASYAAMFKKAIARLKSEISHADKMAGGRRELLCRPPGLVATPACNDLNNSNVGTGGGVLLRSTEKYH
jgi:hypothetical protein